MARCFYYKHDNLRKIKNRDYLFSDLTYSQIYKGILLKGKNPLLNDDWFIDWRNLNDSLYFHSRCGGELYSSQVFNLKESNIKIRKDFLYRFNEAFCWNRDSVWERSIASNEIKKILNIKNYIKDIKYEKSKSVTLFLGKDKEKFPVENFRLRLNRVRGWNFIKSNNYEISYKPHKNSFVFNGIGLGHGVGLCQHGALALSGKGYNRYEILKHYYEDIEFIHTENSDIDSSPYLSYCIFEIFNGEVIKISQQSLMKRIFPPGSFWKVIIALYLAMERQDIFNDYLYRCQGHSKNDGNMPLRCWAIKGHGNNNLEDAISRSCNLYFASLYRSIDFNKFKLFYEKIAGCLLIKQTFIDIKTEKEWAKLLSGLDFNVSLTTKNIINLALLLHPDSNVNAINSFRAAMPLNYQQRIYNALEKTFLIGTGKAPLKEYGDSINYNPLKTNRDIINLIDKNIQGFWGKTSTVIDGTNKPLGYGMFLGGLKDKGIIIFLRNSNGHIASQWARWLLLNNED